MAATYRDINWEGAGYFGVPAPPAGYKYASAEEEAQWAEFETILSAAKQGDFSGVGQLLRIYDGTDSWMLGEACCELIGDIGTRPFFDQLRPAVTSVIDPTYSVDLGRSLAIWGHLSVIPTLLETLEKIADFVDAPALVQMISVLLEPAPGPLSDPDGLHDVAGYSVKVMERRDAVASRLGTDNTIVMFGDIFSIEQLIAVMRRLLLNGEPFDPYLRHKFEATTGINCSDFYQDEILQPLGALATLEAFEDRGDSSRYMPGQRYFFGHRLMG